MTTCGGQCTCGGATADVASVNGVPLQEPGERVDPDDLRERAWAELLRQEAIRQGRLPPQADPRAPGIAAGDQRAIEAMLDDVVPLRMPAQAECERYFAAHAQRFRQGRRAHVRHILFAVTPGVPVPALAARAQEALLQLLQRDAPAERFAELARSLSNCPSAQEGGDLGWIAPQEIAEELARALFDAHETTGLLPRLVHSRHGLHVVEVLAREAGRAVPLAQVRDRIAMELAQRARATALHQYVRLLAGQARIEGIALEAADTPLVQ